MHGEIVMRNQGMKWPNYLSCAAMLTAWIGAALLFWLGSRPWVMVAVIVGLVACFMAVIAVYGDRERIRDLEVQELRDKVEALQSRLEDS